MTGWGQRYTAKAFELNYGWDLPYRPGHGPRLVFSTVHPVSPPPEEGSMWSDAGKVLSWLAEILTSPSTIMDKIERIRQAIGYIRWLHKWGLLSTSTLKKALWMVIDTGMGRRAMGNSTRSMKRERA